MKNEILNLLPPDFPWGESLYVYDTLPSTNTLAKELAKAGAPAGTAVIAVSQSGGRGRMGRTFSSPPGGLYLTVIFRPNCPAEKLMHLTCAAGVAAAEAIKTAAGVTPQLKWINDLILNGRKVGGILTELGLDSRGNADFALVGIGINCAQNIPPELAEIATSLEGETGTPVSPAALAAALLQRLYALSGKLLTNKAALMDTYRSLCLTCNRDILVLRGEERFPAHAIEVTNAGALLVSYPDGHREALQSGEVSIRGLMGYSS